METVTVGFSEAVRALLAGRQTFLGDETGTVLLNGDPFDYVLSLERDEGGQDAAQPLFFILTATNGSGEYRIAESLGKVGFVSGAFCLVANLGSTIPAPHTRPVFSARGTPFISYAQAGEDILLMRALETVEPAGGFYIDVGAYHPDTDSVTRVFYERGWRGVNLEPSTHLFERFRRARPRDINIQAAASSQPGRLPFYRNDGEQLGTLERRFSQPDEQVGAEEVEVVTLADVCSEHCPPEVHFLKIDVEGHEREVLAGMDFTTCRPWIVVIESVAPNRADIPTFGEWEDLLTAARYHFAGADALNRYYICEESRGLAVFFHLPIDNYVRGRDVLLIEQLKTEVEELRGQLASTAPSLLSPRHIARRLLAGLRGSERSS